MSLPANRLYEFLPAIVRQRDAAQGLPLQALINAIASQGKIFEDDLARLLDNLFIETCDDWVVPYLGDLLGVKGLNDLAIPGFSQRARVANTLSYRRRKGTATMLEQLAHDTTGWPARAVEFFQILETTQWLNHLRPTNFRTPDLRETDALELVDTAFDTAAHTVDVRHISSGRGRHNISNIGLFLWRLESYPLELASACPVSAGDGRYFFHPLGIDQPLFNAPQTETDITELAKEIDVPGRLRRRPLFDELEARRAAIATGDTPEPNYFRASPVLTVHIRQTVGGLLQTVPPEQIFISDLSEISPGQWRRPDPIGPGNPPNVAVDPVLGRLSLASGVVPAEVLVSASHGFPGDLGGGPYDRRDSVALFPLATVDWQVAVSADTPTDPTQNIYQTLVEAVDAWNNRAPADGKTGMITLIDNLTYAENLTGTHRLKIGEGEQLLLVSADWPAFPVADVPGATARQFGRINPTQRRAHLQGDIEVEGTAPAASESPGALWIDGLLIEGALTVLDTGTSNLGTLLVAHTTLVPSSGSLIVAGGNEKLSIALRRSICGRIILADTVPTFNLVDSIVDAPGTLAIDGAGTVIDIQASTVRGQVKAQQFSAGNSIFTELIDVDRLQTGCVRFCYIPEGSKTPRRYRCQPELAVSEAETDAAKALAEAQIVPFFTDDAFGAPAYLQLAALVATEISEGADNGSEMGAWYFLCQPQRRTNLLSSLDEYLRLGLEAGLIFAT